MYMHTRPPGTLLACQEKPAWGVFHGMARSGFGGQRAACCCKAPKRSCDYCKQRQGSGGDKSSFGEPPPRPAECCGGGESSPTTPTSLFRYFSPYRKPRRGGWGGREGVPRPRREEEEPWGGREIDARHSGSFMTQQIRDVRAAGPFVTQQPPSRAHLRAPRPAAGAGSRELGLCRPVERTNLSPRPQRPSPQLAWCGRPRPVPVPVPVLPAAGAPAPRGDARGRLPRRLHSSPHVPCAVPGPAGVPPPPPLAV